MDNIFLKVPEVIQMCIPNCKPYFKNINLTILLGKGGNLDFDEKNFWVHTFLQEFLQDFFFLVGAPHFQVKKIKQVFVFLL